MTPERLELETSAYHPPEGMVDYGDRDVEGRRHLKLILYVGDSALLDITERDAISGEPVALLTTVESTPDVAMDLLRHPQAFMSREEAITIFERPNSG